MSNFDLRKYLKENKITFNDSNSIQYTFGGYNRKNQLTENVVVYFYDNSYQYASSTDNAPLPSNLKNVKNIKDLENYIKSHLHNKNSWASVEIDGKSAGRYKADKGFYMTESTDLNEDKIKVGDFIYPAHYSQKDGVVKNSDKKYEVFKVSGTSSSPRYHVKVDGKETIYGPMTSIKVNESISEASPQVKSSSKNDDISDIVRRLNVLANDESTYNRSAVRAVKNAIKTLNGVHFK